VAARVEHRRAIWFGGVQQGKAYVSFHLIGVYAFPGLLKKSFHRFKKEKWV